MHIANIGITPPSPPQSTVPQQVLHQVPLLFAHVELLPCVFFRFHLRSPLPFLFHPLNLFSLFFLSFPDIQEHLFVFRRKQAVQREVVRHLGQRGYGAALRGFVFIGTRNVGKYHGVLVWFVLVGYDNLTRPPFAVGLFL